MRSPCSSRRDQRGELGAVTAELAAALPAAVLAIGIAVGAVAAAAGQVGLEQSAGAAARAAGRGDDAARYADGARLQLERQGELVCATLSRQALGGALTLTARSCAHAGGR
ncbi:TadE family type IV pilus minor pilin [Agrococcus sp. DT81.2]|uniref:TadE family type IV pilus minor pilin n=1 Tax=Agrococcus sp. DT81.2 TaxID=3393414 RepID=UPI003CE47D1B